MPRAFLLSLINIPHLVEFAMVVEELFERTVSMTKTVWRKRGQKITRKEISRMVASDVTPRYKITQKETDDEG